ncbi:MAG: LysR family transcriptional regulator [Actinomycetota bacterium]
MDPFGPLPPLNQLRVFEAAARLLSFTQAGQELHLTQSAVSQQIKALETHLGRPLFVRRQRSIDLTEAGRAYLPVVQRTLDDLAIGTQTVFGRHDERHLTVQVNLSFAIFCLAPKLPDFTDRHPDITVDLVTVIHDPERTADAADVEIRFAEELTGAELLCPLTYVPVCHPDHRADADWRTDRLIECAGMRGGWRPWLNEQGESLPDEQRVHTANTFAVGLRAAERGEALAMSFDAFSAEAIAEGRLVRAFDHTSPTPESYWLAAPRPGQRSDAAEAFRDWISTQTFA